MPEINHLVLSLVMIFGASACAFADEFCAVNVEVSYANGGLADGVYVRLQDSKGGLIKTTRASLGVARFCDFGFGEHSIVVGEVCRTEIGGVHLIYSVPQKFKMVLNVCAKPFVTLGGCYVYGRVQDDLGKPVSDVDVRTDEGESGRTDRYGRIGFHITKGKEADTEFRRVGFETRVVRYSCETARYTEVTVLLRNDPGR